MKLGAGVADGAWVTATIFTTDADPDAVTPRDRQVEGVLTLVWSQPLRVWRASVAGWPVEPSSIRAIAEPDDRPLVAAGGMAFPVRHSSKDGRFLPGSKAGEVASGAAGDGGYDDGIDVVGGRPSQIGASYGEAVKAGLPDGWSAQVSAQKVGDGEVGVLISLSAPGDNRAGQMYRTIGKDESGDVVLKNEAFTIKPDHQGQGIGARVNRETETWARGHGVDRIDLQANIDVGGYAWARQGYDFTPDGQSKLAETLGTWEPKKGAANRASWEDLSSRMALPHGDPGVPTPFELSEWGHTPGAETWDGRDMMLGSSWAATKRLTPG